MDVICNDSQGVLPQIKLGSVAEQIWVKGFKYSSQRKLQVSQPINATKPTVFDRLMVLVNFQFAATQSFSGVNPNGQALKFIGTLDASIPHLANLQFVETADGSGQVAWLKGCGIPKLDLMEKNGATVVIGYTVTGGVWSLS